MLLRTLLALASLSLVAIGAPASAQVSNASLKDLLGRASDSALDKLSRPGAFSADDAIRIALPGTSKGIGGVASRAGPAGDINGSLNRAAEAVAGQAKPIFRAAIDRVSFRAVVGIARGGTTGATEYLRKNTSSEIKTKLLPLVKVALDKTGVLKQVSQLKALGMDEARLAEYVAGKTSDGIFTYVGREEARVRINPVGTGGGLVKGLKY